MNEQVKNPPSSSFDERLKRDLSFLVGIRYGAIRLDTAGNRRSETYSRKEIEAAELFAKSPRSKVIMPFRYLQVPVVEGNHILAIDSVDRSAIDTGWRTGPTDGLTIYFPGKITDATYEIVDRIKSKSIVHWEISEFEAFFQKRGKTLDPALKAAVQALLDYHQDKNLKINEDQKENVLRGILTNSFPDITNLDNELTRDGPKSEEKDVALKVKEGEKEYLIFIDEVPTQGEPRRYQLAIVNQAETQILIPVPRGEKQTYQIPS